MRTIFISYRREDAEGQAGRLFDDLTQHFGSSAVFMDVAGIEPGRDFRRVIDEKVASCGVLLALIGKDWLTAADKDGKRRLDDPLDFVRLEAASALKRDIPVIPVLVQDAAMPNAAQLPADLADLAYRNGVELTHARWDSDVQVLIKALGSYVDTAAKSVTPAPAMGFAGAHATAKRGLPWAAAAAIAALAFGAGGYTWHQASQERAALEAAQEAATNVRNQNQEAAKQAAEEKAKAAAEKAANDDAKRRAEDEQLAREKAQQQAQADKIAAERARHQAQSERIAREQANAAREARIALEREKQQAEADRLAAEKARLEAERIAMLTKQRERAAAEEAERRRDAERRRQAQLGACPQGYVWREAGANDRVCVTPASRAQAAYDNQMAAARRQAGGGAYGPATCKQGYVWREAFAGDTVCVTPDIRARAAEENARAASRMARG